jgi:hypothetical protein
VNKLIKQTSGQTLGLKASLKQNDLELMLKLFDAGKRGQSEPDWQTVPCNMPSHREGTLAQPKSSAQND